MDFAAYARLADRVVALSKAQVRSHQRKLKDGRTITVKGHNRRDRRPLGHAADLAPTSVVWRTARNAKHLGRYGDFVVEEHENKAHGSHRFKVRQWSDLTPWPGIGYASMTAEQAHDLARHLAERQHAGVSPDDAMSEWAERHPDPTIHDAADSPRVRAILDQMDGRAPRSLQQQHAEHFDRMEREARQAGQHDYADRIAEFRAAALAT